MTDPSPAPPPTNDALETATLGSGCFWCTEAVFQQLRGVKSVVSGYCGGTSGRPTYEQVCSGTTGHAEAVQITFDPREITFAELLEAFFTTHDPTTLNRQGADVGTQYRSAIFYHTSAQRETAQRCIQALGASGAYDVPIVTQLVPAVEFYPAEAYHQNYYVEHSRQSYCQFVIRPKVEKVRQALADKVKA